MFKASTGCAESISTSASFTGETRPSWFLSMHFGLNRIPWSTVLVTLVNAFWAFLHSGIEKCSAFAFSDSSVIKSSRSMFYSCCTRSEFYLIVYSLHLTLYFKFFFAVRLSSLSFWRINLFIGVWGRSDFCWNLLYSNAYLIGYTEPYINHSASWHRIISHFTVSGKWNIRVCIRLSMSIVCFYFYSSSHKYFWACREALGTIRSKKCIQGGPKK